MCWTEEKKIFRLFTLAVRVRNQILESLFFSRSNFVGRTLLNLWIFNFVSQPEREVQIETFRFVFAQVRNWQLLENENVSGKLLTTTALDVPWLFQNKLAILRNREGAQEILTSVEKESRKFRLMRLFENFEEVLLKGNNSFCGVNYGQFFDFDLISRSKLSSRENAQAVQILTAVKQPWAC